MSRIEPGSGVIRSALTLLKSRTEFVVFDLETTGKSFLKEKGGHKVLQIAARRYAYDPHTGAASMMAEINLFLNDPTITEIDPYLTEHVHRIGMLQIRDPRAAAARGARLVSPKEGWRRFLSLIGPDTVLVGQNISGFDIDFADAELSRHGLARRLTGLAVVDTLPIARTLWDLDNRSQTAPGYKLRSLANRLQVRTDPRMDHNALGDIDTTWRVLMAELKEMHSYAYKFLRGTPDQYKGQLGGLRKEIPPQR